MLELSTILKVWGGSSPITNQHRILWIDVRIRAKTFPNCGEISRRFGISRRQAQRDISFLRDSLFAPIAYSKTRRGYYYTDNDFVLPVLFMSEQENRDTFSSTREYREVQQSRLASHPPPPAAIWPILGSKPKRILGTAWEPLWMTQMGCIRACAVSMGMDIPIPLLYGATGQGFILNLKENVCPSSPTAWRREAVTRLLANAGIYESMICVPASDADLGKAQLWAWQRTQTSIDSGRPSYAWGVVLPEFYLICGYDESGYYYSGPGQDGIRGPKPWSHLGKNGVAALEVHWPAPGQRAGIKTIVVQGLEFAMEFSQKGSPWVLPGYTSGPEAYDVWIEGLSSKKAAYLGTAYNAACLLECRSNAVAFLEESSKELRNSAPKALFEAIQRYRHIEHLLGQLVALFPMSPSRRERPADLCDQAVPLLESLKAEESRGLEALSRVVDSLSH